ncbi:MULTISPECIES: DUF5999 family protein [Herbidospora]|uniref:DUF5999 family protein n=1 Tax=Herbidospora TaxID=28443 RepID=UPI0004C41255|nr:MULTISPECIES: DUF5999 family protein [Herbidospora]GLX96788.1 hypothetical protein Hesp01_47380 [Herbidospora sp. NBRC 101105]
MCQHQPHCPSAYASDRSSAHVVAAHPEQGWSLLCNGVVLFEDTGLLMPDCTVAIPHRAPEHLVMA